MPDLIHSDNDAPHLPITGLNQLIETLQRTPADKFLVLPNISTFLQKMCCHTQLGQTHTTQGTALP